MAHFTVMKYLSLLMVIFPFLASAQPDPVIPATQAEVNAGIIHNKFVAPDTLAGSGGGGGSGTGIQTNRGTGNGNTFTNANLVTSGNTQAAITTTNYAGAENGPNVVVMDMWGSSATNTPTILASVAPGDGALGRILFNGMHSGSFNAALSELEFDSGGPISLVPSYGTAGSHVQVGGASLAWMYMQANGLATTTGARVPSGIMTWKTRWASNTVTYVLDENPGIIGMWDATNSAGDVVQKQWSLNFFADSQNVDSWSTNAIFSGNAYGQKFFFGTNANGYFQGATLTGLNAAESTNQLVIGTNQIGVSGNFTDVSPSLDSWTAPNTFNAANNLFSIIGSSTTVGVGINGTVGVLEVGNGSGGAANSFFISGENGFNGNMFPNGGVSIGTNNVAFSGYQLVVGGNGQSIVPTNAAPYKTVTPSGLNTIAQNKGWTNNFGARADLIVQYTFTGTTLATNWIAFTNTTSGECWTNCLSNGSSGTAGEPNASFTVVYPDISPNDQGTLSNYIQAGPGVAAIFAKWKLK